MKTSKVIVSVGSKMDLEHLMVKPKESSRFTVSRMLSQHSS